MFDTDLLRTLPFLFCYISVPNFTLETPVRLLAFSEVGTKQTEMQ